MICVGAGAIVTGTGETATGAARGIATVTGDAATIETETATETATGTVIGETATEAAATGNVTGTATALIVAAVIVTGTATALGTAAGTDDTIPTTRPHLANTAF